MTSLLPGPLLSGSKTWLCRGGGGGGVTILLRAKHMRFTRTETLLCCEKNTAPIVFELFFNMKIVLTFIIDISMELIKCFKLFQA